MKVIPPLIVTPTMLTSSSIAEPDTTTGEVVWVSGTTYPTIGTRIIVVSTHRIYEKRTSNISTNLTVSPQSNTIDWLDVAPTNRWAMFDSTRTTGSTFTSSVTLTIAPGASSSSRVNSIAMIGCTISNLNISVTSGGSSTYTYSGAVSTAPASIVKFDIPPYTNSIFTIVFSVSSGTGIISNVVFGSYIDIGNIQNGISLETLNFSKVERDAFGNSVLIPRRSVPRTSQKTFIPKALVNMLMTARESLNAVPAVWVGIDDSTDIYFEPLLIFGVYKEFSISMDYPTHAIVSLQLEEM